MKSKSPEPSGATNRSNLWSNLLLFLAVLGSLLALEVILNPNNLWAASSKQVETTGPMQVPRQAHTATLLPDGRVLIVGGLGANGALDSVEVYDRTNKQFFAVGDPAAPTKLTHARAAHSASLVQLGDSTYRVIIAGGIDAQSQPLASIEIFEPATGTIVATDNLTTPRRSHTATVLADGRIFFAGGDSAGDGHSTAETYDPNNSLGPVQFNLADARWGHTATLFSDE